MLRVAELEFLMLNYRNSGEFWAWAEEYDEQQSLMDVYNGELTSIVEVGISARPWWRNVFGPFSLYYGYTFLYRIH